MVFNLLSYDDKFTIVISWANSSSLPPYMTTKCKTFLLLESLT